MISGQPGIVWISGTGGTVWWWLRVVGCGYGEYWFYVLDAWGVIEEIIKDGRMCVVVIRVDR